MVLPDEWGIVEWGEMYKKHLTLSISDPDRFKKALEIYGTAPVYEAIVSSSLRKIEGDPINYVLAVAHANWKKDREMEEESVRYQMRIDMAKDYTREQGASLSNKIDKAKRKLRNGKD
jgi:hypothetical protein